MDLTDNNELITDLGSWSFKCVFEEHIITSSGYVFTFNNHYLN